jgi:uncharacterized protein (TIGR00255 family)
MIKSMTGFARAEETNGSKKCVVEARTVNHRFLELNLRMPAKDLELERRVRKVLEGKISRGYAEITITVSDNDTVKKKLTLDEELVKQFLSASEILKKKYSVVGEPDMASILALRDIFKFEEDASNLEERWELIKPALESALDSLVAMRAAEGSALKKDVVARLDSIEGSAARITETRKRQEGDILEKYRKKIEEVAGTEMDPQRGMIEAAVLAERSDISEEIVRMECHMKQMRELLEPGGLAGRKMEFITQEINREANTIGSKSVLYDISREVVEIKSNLEKIREQTANIE